jgi:Gpi18-like mannosyltransferase
LERAALSTPEYRDVSLRRLSNRIADGCLLLVGITVALYLRYSFRNFETADYEYDTSRWYAAIQHLGLSAAGTDVSNYTPPYLYLLSLVFALLPSVAPPVAIKVPSVVFDFVCAGLVYGMVRLKYANRRIAILALLAVCSLQLSWSTVHYGDRRTASTPRCFWPASTA